MVLAPKDWDYPTLFLCVLCDIKFQIDFGQQMDVITLNNLILNPNQAGGAESTPSRFLPILTHLE